MYYQFTYQKADGKTYVDVPHKVRMKKDYDKTNDFISVYEWLLGFGLEKKKVRQKVDTHDTVYIEGAHFDSIRFNQLSMVVRMEIVSQLLEIELSRGNKARGFAYRIDDFVKEHIFKHIFLTSLFSPLIAYVKLCFCVKNNSYNYLEFCAEKFFEEPLDNEW